MEILQPAHLLSKFLLFRRLNGPYFLTEDGHTSDLYMHVLPVTEANA